MEPPRTNLRSSRLRWWILPIVAALAAGGFLAYRLAGQADAPPAPPVAAAPPAPAAEATPVPANAVTAAAETPVGPEGARALLEGASTNGTFRSWLGVGDLVRRWAVVTANVAEGTSPRRWLGPLAPGAPFSVAERGDRVAIAAGSYARYDGVADAIESIDARSLATAYRRLHRAIDAAHEALGYPRGTLDRATARALRRIEGAPVATSDVLVERREGLYAFVDPALERLGEIEKHLVRMGPRNERIVQAKARELREALALPAVARAR